MFSLREYFINIAENTGSTIGYNEREVTDNIQSVYVATQTWGKHMKFRDILFALRISAYKS